MKTILKNFAVFLSLILFLELISFCLYSISFEKTSWVQHVPPVKSEDFHNDWKTNNLPPWTHGKNKGQFPNGSQFSIGADGFRELSHSPQKNTRELYLFGGSLIFGYGVNDNETIEYFLHDILDQETFVKNLGLNGAGPDHHLITLQKKPELFKGKSNRPIGIYFFLNDHINRVNWNFYHGYFSRLKAPFYYLEGRDLKGGEPLYHNNLPYFALLTLAKASYTFKLALSLRSHEVTIPENFSQNDIKLTATIIKKLRAEFLKLNPEGKFLVFSFEPLPSVIKQLKEEGIVFDNEVPIHRSLTKEHFLPDGHFSVEGNKRVAQLIKRYIILATE